MSGALLVQAVPVVREAARREAAARLRVALVLPGRATMEATLEVVHRSRAVAVVALVPSAVPVRVPLPATVGTEFRVPFRERLHTMAVEAVVVSTTTTLPALVVKAAVVLGVRTGPQQRLEPRTQEVAVVVLGRMVRITRWVVLEDQAS